MRFTEESNLTEPLIEGYDLAQCVRLKEQLERYRRMRMNIFAIIFYTWLAVWGLIAGCVWVLDWAGVITYVEDGIRDTIVPLMFVLFMTGAWGILSAGYDKLYIAVKKRIRTLCELD